MNIDFLLVCDVTFSTVCLLLYDHLALPISNHGSVPILSSIRMFLMATVGRKLIILKKTLAQTNTHSFSLLCNRVHVGWGVCVWCAWAALLHEQSFLSGQVSDGWFVLHIT